MRHQEEDDVCLTSTHEGDSRANLFAGLRMDSTSDSGFLFVLPHPFHLPHKKIMLASMKHSLRTVHAANSL